MSISTWTRRFSPDSSEIAAGKAPDLLGHDARRQRFRCLASKLVVRIMSLQAFGVDPGNNVAGRIPDRRACRATIHEFCAYAAVRFPLGGSNASGWACR